MERDPGLPRPPACPFPVVGIGASAGGLEAISSVLRALPSDPGMAFIIVQHLDPLHESFLTEILAKATPMAVEQVRDGASIRPDRVYVIPPDADMVMQRARLKLTPRPESRRGHMPIDLMFRSLAEAQGEHAVGVLLSGSSSDGVLGMRAIKSEGGLTLVQNQETAKFFDMPQSAIASGYVDSVLPPEGIARELVRVSRHPYLQKPAIDEPVPHQDAAAIGRIFSMLRASTGVDFTYYKQTTIRRRLARRMALHRCDDLTDYARHLDQQPGELEHLYRDLLIPVTGFFRDPAAFEALKVRVFPALLKHRSDADPVRIWVPGCSTGEEAFSIAICLFEYLSKHSVEVPIQIFATDLNEAALDRARTGSYLGNIALEVSPNRLRRFFTRFNGGYQVAKHVRNVCVFAKQNATKDPPFSKIDLISCRNLLIYFGPILQKRVLPTFHYALKPGGFLFLGSAESVGEFTNLFEAVDKKHKIYARMAVPTPSNLTISGGGVSVSELPAPVEAALIRPGHPTTDALREADRLVLTRFAPAGVLISDDMEILQFRGNTSPYLLPSPGKASLNLLKMAREGLLLELREAIRRARRNGAAVRKEGIPVDSDRRHLVNIEVLPVKSPGTFLKYFLVLFETVVPKGRRPKDRPVPTRKSPNDFDHLKRELASTKEYLQSSLEDQESMNEELKSANEEILSSNEELQSTNEELQTAKEELQSTNEELSTINDELQNRNLELSRANNDLSNLVGSFQTPILILGADLRIRRFTPQAEKVLNLLPADIGRPISDLHLNIEDAGLEEAIEEVIEKVRSNERIVADRSGRSYVLRAFPYRTSDNRIDGAVLAFIERTDRGANGPFAIEPTFRVIVDACVDGVITVDAGGRIVYSNPAAQKLAGYEAADLDGKPLSTLLPSSYHDALREELGRHRNPGQLPRISEILKIPILRKDGSEIEVEASVSPWRNGNEVNYMLVGRRRS